MKVLSIILGLALFSQAFASVKFDCQSTARLEFYDNGNVRVSGTRPVPKVPRLVFSPDYGVQFAAMTMELQIRSFDFVVPTKSIYDNSRVRLWSFDARKMDGTSVYFQQRNGRSNLIYVKGTRSVNANCKKVGVSIPTSSTDV